MNIQDLIRENVRKLKPYSSARKEYSGNANILLDANESPFENGMNRYPDPVQTELKLKLGKINNIEVENIFLGNGSDEIIDLLIRVFCEPNKDEIMILPPTFGMYEVAANISSVSVKKVNLTSDYQPNSKEILKNASTQTKLLFLCSPNNPTGNSFDQKIIKNLIKNFPGIVVIDEAYIDFAEQESAINWIANFPNLVVLQTFSKAWGLAGIRLGMSIGSVEIIEALNRVKLPYNVNCLTQKIALNSLEKIDLKRHRVKQILKHKEILKTQLEKFDFVEKIYPSDANFYLVRVENPVKLIQFLRDGGIIIRDRSKNILCHNCVRISVGSKDENEAMVKALKEYQNDNLKKNEKSTFYRS